MKKQYKNWLKKKWHVKVLAVLCFFLGVALGVGLANDEITRAKQAGSNIGSSIRGNLGSSSAVNQKLLQPLLTPTPMVPLSGNETQSFNATILCPSSKEFLKVDIRLLAEGDLIFYISYDKGLTGTLNTSLIVSGISAVCADGFMICQAGTMSNCESYVFYLDGNILRYKKANVKDKGLSGCFCVNNACGGSQVVSTNLNYILRTVGGMVVSAFLNNPTMRTYAVADVRIEGWSITFYGQDSSQCKFTDQGSSSVENLKNYYRDAGSLKTTGNVRLMNQLNDPQGLTYAIDKASQSSLGNTKTCIIKKVAYGCSVIEITEGDCSVTSSCKVEEEIWDDVPIIQGGGRTNLVPKGSCIRDECNNLRCYDWTTKKMVYVCSAQKIFDPSPRVDTVSRSTFWDRESGIVYYNDLVIRSDCRAECPIGYTFNNALKKCVADPICPSGFSFDRRSKLCITNDLSYCQNSCKNCPPGYVYDDRYKICIAAPFCSVENFSIVYEDGKLKCVVDPQGEPNCPSGSSYDNNTNVCYTLGSCVLSIFDPAVKLCVVPPNCQGGRYNEETKICEASRFCPVGVYNRITGKCEEIPSFCSEENVWDEETYRCLSCPYGYYYDSYRKTCVDSDGYSIVPTFISLCPEEASYYNPFTGLCEGYLQCPPDYTFDEARNICKGSPSCPQKFWFEFSVGKCVSIPNCPNDFTYDASRGICVAKTSFIFANCPSGYDYDNNMGKCVMATSCPGGGIWDNTLKKCVKRSFCVYEDFCWERPRCQGAGRWDENVGLCIIETTCSDNMVWEEDPGKSFELKKWEEGSDCEFACKIKVKEPKTDVYMKSSTEPNANPQYGTKTEKTFVSVGINYYYRPCIEEATNVWKCPVDRSNGEEIEKDCECVNNFGIAATMMQVIRQAGQDFICSSSQKR
jgi:hypothetical protein